MALERPGCGTILVVEDDERLCASIVAILERGGYATRTAASGEEALDLAASEAPDLVLLDVRLPGLSGYEVCRELRGRFGTGLPIIFMSGEKADPLDRVAGLLIGGDDYLVKPFLHDELLARVRLRRSDTARPRNAPRLTPRELEVLSLLGSGLAQADIADRLVVSPRTVGTHIEGILAKLGVHSRSQALAVAFRDGLIGASA